KQMLAQQLGKTEGKEGQDDVGEKVQDKKLSFQSPNQGAGTSSSRAHPGLAKRQIPSPSRVAIGDAHDRRAILSSPVIGAPASCPFSLLRVTIATSPPTVCQLCHGLDADTLSDGPAGSLWRWYRRRRRQILADALVGIGDAFPRIVRPCAGLGL